MSGGMSPEAAALVEQARRMMDAGRPAEAVPLYKKAATLRADRAVLDPEYADALCSCGEYGAARRVLERTRAVSRGAEVLWRLGQCYRHTGDLERAKRSYLEALDDDASHPIALSQYASLLTYIGEHERAAELLIERYEAGFDHPLAAIAFAEIASRVDRLETAERWLQRHAHDASQLDENRSRVLFALGRVLHAQGKYDEAWEAYRDANERSSVRSRIEAEERRAERVMKYWAGDDEPTLADADAARALPVFVVGMPRSGSSLIERILAAHPSVVDGGELDTVPELLRESGLEQHGLADGSAATALTPKLRQRLSGKLLGRYRRLAGRAERIIDKQLFNFFHLGFIHAVCPGAAILRCVRDPRDIGLSCYQQPFGTVHFASDLGSIARMTVLEHRLMKHWKRTRPESPILDVVYEQLVEDPEPIVRRMLDHVGLPFHEDCLRHHHGSSMTQTASFDQVRSPIYRSSAGRWKRYEAHLGPLIEQLGPLAAYPRGEGVG